MFYGVLKENLTRQRLMVLLVVAAVLFCVSRPFESGARAAALSAKAERSRIAVTSLVYRLERLRDEGRITKQEADLWVARAYQIMETPE